MSKTGFKVTSVSLIVVKPLLKMPVTSAIKKDWKSSFAFPKIELQPLHYTEHGMERYSGIAL